MRLTAPNWPWPDANITTQRAVPPGLGNEFTISAGAWRVYVMAPLASGPFQILGSWGPL